MFSLVRFQSRTAVPLLRSVGVPQSGRWVSSTCVARASTLCRAPSALSRSTAFRSVAMQRTTRHALPVHKTAVRKFSSSGQEKESLRDMYMRWLTERPILTKSVTSGVIAMLGDVACQFLVEDGPFSFRRCFNMTVLGVALVGPGLHYWYSALARWIPGTSTGAVLGRLALDQTVWAPIFIAAFFTCMSLLQGKPEAIIPNLKQNVWDAMIVNWKLWPAANFVNFKFVPVQLQVLFANFVALIWNTYLSWATSRDVTVEEITES